MKYLVRNEMLMQTIKVDATSPHDAVDKADRYFTGLKPLYVVHEMDVGEGGVDVYLTQTYEYTVKPATAQANIGTQR